MKAFEYQVCQVQLSRVTFANGRWLGTAPQDHQDVQHAFNSCPTVWDHLDHAGADGWELAAVTTRTESGGQVMDILYLKRPR